MPFIIRLPLAAEALLDNLGWPGNACQACHRHWNFASALRQFPQCSIMILPKYPAAVRWWNAAGCDKRLATCSERFSNVLNFRGEPYVPGQGAMMCYPDAR